ncbi:Ulp1 protease family [Hirschfeldia incana]|nr:Ulp1 protease family [Hirschfeldia incana]
MAKSNSRKTYPPRLYEEGKCPLQSRSMNHNCHLANLQMVEEVVGVDAWESIKTSSVGVILRLKELTYTWSAKAVHHLLTNQLVVNNIHEIWSAIDGQPIRFSLYEFGDITGLNCEPFNINDKVEIDHKPFWEELGVSPSHGPMLSELQLLLSKVGNWTFEKRRMVGLLCVLSVGVLGISPGSRIPLDQAKRNKYTLRGCVHALLIWVYESIPGIGHEYGNHIEGNQVPLLSWHGSRGRINWDQFYKKEKNLHQKVRVRHLIVKPEVEIYPQWPEDKVDDDLHNLITDILHGELDDTYWNLNSRTATVPNKEKRKLVSEEEDCMKIKMPKERTSTHACGSSLNSTRDDTIQLGLMEALNSLTAKVGSMDTVIVEKVLSAVDTSVDAKVNARIGEAELVFTKKLTNLQEEIAQFREQMQAIAPKNDAHYNVNHEDEVNSNDLSWMVQDKAPSQMDAAVKCVARKKAKKSEVKPTSPILLDIGGEKVVGTTQVKKPARGLKNVKEKVEVPQLRDSGGTWSNSEEKQKYGKLGATLDQLVASVLDGPLQKRKPQLTKTQVGDNDVDTHFYTKLITPRNLWETDDFGWLSDSHMASAMLMFHKRAMRDPSPYSARIAFLEHWFINMWVRDYKKYDPKTWKFSDSYKKVFNGNYPQEFSNNRKWLKDVDRLFLCHLINGDHWVALEVDLDKKIIHVYDSIQTVVPSTTYLLEECRPFTKMIHLLLKEMIPEKKSTQQFRISRLKNVPHNEKPGDCGVYALKYIECKAIGCGFEGLSDECIPAMRIKLAAEIYDEVLVL